MHLGREKNNVVDTMRKTQRRVEVCILLKLVENKLHQINQKIFTKGVIVLTEK